MFDKICFWIGDRISDLIYWTVHAPIYQVQAALIFSGGLLVLYLLFIIRAKQARRKIYFVSRPTVVRPEPEVELPTSDPTWALHTPASSQNREVGLPSGI